MEALTSKLCGEEVDDRGGELIRGRQLARGGQGVFGASDFDEGGGHTGGVQTPGEFGGLDECCVVSRPTGP